MFNALSFRRLVLAAAASVTLAGTAFAGQDASSVGTRIYSPSPLIVQMNGHHGATSRQQQPVRTADPALVGTSIYAPRPLLTMTRHDRLVTAINQAFGTSFPTGTANTALAMHDR